MRAWAELSARFESARWRRSSGSARQRDRVSCDQETRPIREARDQRDANLPAKGDRMHAAVEFEARPEETRVETRQHLVEREGGAEEPSPGEHVDQLLRGLGHCRRDDSRAPRRRRSPRSPWSDRRGSRRSGRAADRSDAPPSARAVTPRARLRRRARPGRSDPPRGAPPRRARARAREPSGHAAPR
jgi:hypothetical protein